MLEVLASHIPDLELPDLQGVLLLFYIQIITAKLYVCFQPPRNSLNAARSKVGQTASSTNGASQQAANSVAMNNINVNLQSVSTVASTSYV